MDIAPDVDTAEKLRAFGRCLVARSNDVIVRRRFGRPASPAALEKVRWLRPDLLALYRAMDGCVIEWRFRDQPGGPRDGNGGCLHIPSLYENSRGFDIGLDPDLDAGNVALMDRAPFDHFWLVPFFDSGKDLHLFDASDEYAYNVGGMVREYVDAAVEALAMRGWLLRLSYAHSSDAVDLRIAEARRRLGWP